ncbi:carboxylesterase family protein [Ottowia thiooxydans]|uniref:carboxylesterase family protein n=1 Tax=Ottowia thiooxydans TaxID=219182 RepID=UPI00040C2786|nr:carboxylesterase family protein [Ottowia thiooxydans]
MHEFKSIDQDGNTVKVRTRAGEIVGRVLGKPDDALGQAGCWMNVPYARAPVGPLRFSPPQPLPKSGNQSTQVDARSPDPIVAPQLPSRLEDVLGSFAGTQQEDCLRLNIWSPLEALGSQPTRPVLVWLHGGAWITGGGGISWYDGTQWAREAGIVVVGVNYRLGALGWLAGDDAEQNNLGLQDSQMALQWVAEHIGAFGGDPSRVTVMGQSAGGDNIGALMQSRRSLLFQQAVLQSAPLGRELRTLEEAHAIRQVVMQQWGASNLNQIQQLPLDALLKGQSNPAVMAQMKALGIAGQAYMVVADDFHVNAEGRERYLKSAARVPSIVGATTDEMTAFPDMQRVDSDLAIGRRIFNAGAERWQREAEAAGQKCWRYEFQFGPNPRYGACHCIELPFTFGTLPAFSEAPMLVGGHAAQMDALSRRWRGALQSFVIQGDPLWPERQGGVHNVDAAH